MTPCTDTGDAACSARNVYSSHKLLTVFIYGFTVSGVTQNTVRPTERRTLREQCYDQLRALIVDGSLHPGSHLVETRLGEQLGVSRGPLREALRHLEREGLAVSDGKGHLLVREVSAEEIEESFEVRCALEVTAITRLARRADREAISRQLLTALEPLKDPDLPFATQIEVDLHFHELLCTLSGNATLATMWHQLMGQIRMMIIAAGPERAGTRMRWQEHAPLAEAVATGDAEHCRRLIEAHMNDFCHRYADDAIDKELGIA